MNDEHTCAYFLSSLLLNLEEYFCTANQINLLKFRKTELRKESNIHYKYDGEMNIMTFAQ